MTIPFSEIATYTRNRINAAYDKTQLNESLPAITRKNGGYYLAITQSDNTDIAVAGLLSSNPDIREAHQTALKQVLKKLSKIDREQLVDAVIHLYLLGEIPEQSNKWQLRRHAIAAFYDGKNRVILPHQYHFLNNQEAFLNHFFPNWTTWVEQIKQISTIHYVERFTPLKQESEQQSK